MTALGDRNATRCIRELEAQLQAAKERIRLLEAELGAGDPIPPAFGLTKLQQRILGVIARRPVATRDAILAAAYDDPDMERSPQVVDVQVCCIRRKLKPHGIAIKARWGEGYYLPPESRDQLERLRAA